MSKNKENTCKMSHLEQYHDLLQPYFTEIQQFTAKIEKIRENTRKHRFIHKMSKNTENTCKMGHLEHIHDLLQPYIYINTSNYSKNRENTEKA